MLQNNKILESFITKIVVDLTKNELIKDLIFEIYNDIFINHINEIYKFYDSIDLFFKLFTFFIDSIPTSDYSSLIKLFCNIIYNHPILELEYNYSDINRNSNNFNLPTSVSSANTISSSLPENEDLLLQRYFSILNRMLQKYQLESDDEYLKIYNLLMSNVLFISQNYKVCNSNIYPPKAKNIITIYFGFDILFTICKYSIKCATIFSQFLTNYYQNLKKTDIILDKYNMKNENLKIRKSNTQTGLTGLKNCGSTCYMNSVLQQLYMIPEFKQSIINIQIPFYENKQTDLLYQFQRLFVLLQNSPLQFISPLDFIKSCKIDGEDIRLGVQGDAVEFMQQIFQNIENRLSATKYEHLLTELFGAEDVSELRAKCSYYPNKIHQSIRTNQSYMFTVDVLNMESLEESLKSYISSEVVEYSWDENGEENEEGEGSKKEKRKENDMEEEDDNYPKKDKLDTSKRTSLGKCPQHLIIHLKRFTHDSLFEFRKVNTYFSFPNDLDIYPYTAEGRPDNPIPPAPHLNSEPNKNKNYMYKLRGIVVHSGTMQSGHYYSYIQSRYSNKWYEFNDTTVKPFDPSRISEECFGNNNNNNNKNHNNNSYCCDMDDRILGGGNNSGEMSPIVSINDLPSEYSKNALILFYDHVEYKADNPIPITPAPSINMSKRNDFMNSIEDNEDAFLFGKIPSIYLGGNLADIRKNKDEENMNSMVLLNVDSNAENSGIISTPKIFDEELNDLNDLVELMKMGYGGNSSFLTRIQSRIFIFINQLLEYYRNNNEIRKCYYEYISTIYKLDSNILKDISNYSELMNLFISNNKTNDNNNNNEMGKIEDDKVTEESINHWKIIEIHLQKLIDEPGEENRKKVLALIDPVLDKKKNILSLFLNDNNRFGTIPETKKEYENTESLCILIIMKLYEILTKSGGIEVKQILHLIFELCKGNVELSKLLIKCGFVTVIIDKIYDDKDKEKFSFVDLCYEYGIKAANMLLKYTKLNPINSAIGTIKIDDDTIKRIYNFKIETLLDLLFKPNSRKFDYRDFLTNIYINNVLLLLLFNYID